MERRQWRIFQVGDKTIENYSSDWQLSVFSVLMEILNTLKNNHKIYGDNEGSSCIYLSWSVFCKITCKKLCQVGLGDDLTLMNISTLIMSVYLSCTGLSSTQDNQNHRSYTERNLSKWFSGKLLLSAVVDSCAELQEVLGKTAQVWVCCLLWAF